MLPLARPATGTFYFLEGRHATARPLHAAWGKGVTPEAMAAPGADWPIRSALANIVRCDCARESTASRSCRQ